MGLDSSNCVQSDISRIKQSIPYAIFVIGIVYSLYLLTFVYSESFPSFDAGLKFLMVQQYSTGDFSTALHSSHAPWVQQLWDQGFFPIKEPFVYSRGGERLVVFPFLFQILSTPFFMLFGQWGLLIIPLLSLWLLWYKFIALCGLLKIDTYLIALFSATLIFATPLTVYGVAFWEHTLAALLVFFCFEYVILVKRGSFSTPQGMLFGILSGFSVWLRPESFVFILPLLFFVTFSGNARVRPFLVAVVLVILGFFVINLVVFNRPFGFHSQQVLGSFDFSGLPRQYLERFASMYLNLLKTFPMVLVFFLSIPLILRKFRETFLFPASVSVVFFLTFSVLIFPNDGGGQWGPRYFLIAFPPIALISAYFFNEIVTMKPAFHKRVFGTLFLLALIMGSLINFSGATDYLFTVYYLRANPLLHYLQKSDIENIVSNTYVPIELATIYHQKNFFYSEELLKSSGPLLEAFLERKTSSFFLITAKEPGDFPPEILRANGTRISLEYRVIPVIGLYRLVQVRIDDRTGPLIGVD